MININKNPFRPGRDALPPLDVRLDGKSAPPLSALAIRAISVKDVTADDSRMSVYDALGNVVSQELPAYESADNPNKVYFFWDARNRNERLVGSGTYLAILTVRSVDGNDTIAKRKIGIWH